MNAPLTPRQKKILALAKRNIRPMGRMDEAIRRELGMYYIHYYMELAALLYDPRAEAEDPILMRSLRWRYEVSLPKPDDVFQPFGEPAAQ